MIKVHIYYVAIGKNNRMSGKIFLAHSNNPYRFATWVKYIITNLKRTMSFPPINRQNRSIISAQFPMARRHGYHEPRRTVFLHVEKEPVELVAYLLMHPSHVVLRHDAEDERREAMRGHGTARCKRKLRRPIHPAHDSLPMSATPSALISSGVILEKSIFTAVACTVACSVSAGLS